MNAELKDSVFVFYTRPAKPCKLGKTTEDTYSYNPYKGVAVAGPVSTTLQVVVPHLIVVDPKECGNISMASLAPFMFVSYNWNKQMGSLGDLLEEAKKQLCPQSKQS